MDELTFDPVNTQNTDTTMEVEGLEDQIEEIQQAYPEQDWRTPAQVEAENQAQAEQQTPIEAQPTQESQSVTPTEVVSEEPEPFDWGNPEGQYNDHIVHAINAGMSSPDGYIPSELIKDRNGKPLPEGIIKSQRLNYGYIEKEHKLWEDYKENGGDANLENQLNTINAIRNDPELLQRYDRNGDGQFTISDWHDMSRANGGDGLTPEQEIALTDKWISGLQNKSWLRRGKGFFRQFLADGVLWDGVGHLDTNMARFTGTRRLQALGPDALMKEQGESTRQSQLGSLFDLGNTILEAPEKLWAANQVQREQGEATNDPRTWFDGDTFATTDAKLDDWVYNHDNEMSLGYAVNHPTNRVWSDKMMYEMTYYGVPAVATTVATGGLGTGAFAGIVLETIPLATFRDLSEKGIGNMYEESNILKSYAESHPDWYIDGAPATQYLETPWGRQLAHVGDEVVWDGGTQAVLFGLGNTLRHGIPEAYRFGSKWLAQHDISIKPWSRHKTTPQRNPKYFLDAKKQQINDKIEAGQSQQRIAEEGPSSPWVKDPWSDSSINSTYGDFKNGPNQTGQGIAKIRGDVLDINNQLDEIDGAVLREGGSTDGFLKPLEEAEFSKSGIPDPWMTGKLNEYWNSPRLKAQLDELNPLQRTLGTYGKSTLKRIQEVLGRDASSLSPTEYWGKTFTDTPLKPGEALDDIKAFVTKNLVVQDAVNMSLLKSLRDTANGAGEMLGKADVFATGGPMRRIANNLVTGLTQVKKTQFTWDLAAKRMKESGGELTQDMVEEINGLVAKRSVQLQQENMDGVRLMMQVLEDSDSDELAEGILDVFKVSNDIHNFKDFDAWMRQKISGGEFNGKVKTGVLIKELQGVMINSILSGPKTPMRALLGTTVNSYLNAINEAAGATLRRPFTNDIASQRASIAKLKGMFEIIPEATDVFRKNWKAKFNANIADIRTRYSEPTTRGDENWHLFGEWTEKNGNMGDKAAFYMANIARNLNNNKLLSWSPRALAATDDTFKWLLARARSKEIGMRQALEVAGDTHTKFSPDLMKQAEDIHYKNLLDADGNLDLGQDAWLNKQFKEVTLTSELTGFSKELDTLLKDKPLVRPFYLFARTGINGLNFTYKNTPLLGALHKESIDILRHTGDDYSSLFKYGIENADDLANARNLFAGRQAVGAATVTTFAGMYMGGQMTGNGPADRQLRQNWINAGWKPNHIYIGDVGFDYTSLEPYNTIFSTIADIGDNMELMGSEWAEKRLQAIAFVVGRGLTGKTYMSGLDQMMQIAQMKPGSIDKAGANILNNSIPLAGMRNEFGKWLNPHMKELNSDMWTSIRNRNQASEFLAGGDKLPEKSDLLNGKPIKDWNIIHRSFNAVSPVGLDIRNDTPGRRLLLDSNYDLKSTTYAYGGYSFVKDAHVRAHFQNAIGTVPITVGFKKFKNVEEALNHLAGRKDIKNSMEDMKRDGSNPANWDLDPNTYPHNTLIDNVMNQARSKAWAKINDPSHPGYSRVQQLKAEKDGKDSKTRDNRQEILDLSFPNKSIENFPK